MKLTRLARTLFFALLPLLTALPLTTASAEVWPIYGKGRLLTFVKPAKAHLFVQGSVNASGDVDPIVQGGSMYLTEKTATWWPIIIPEVPDGFEDTYIRFVMFPWTTEVCKLNPFDESCNDNLWNVDFVAPSRAPLTPGVYENTVGSQWTMYTKYTSHTKYTSPWKLEQCNRQGGISSDDTADSCPLPGLHLTSPNYSFFCGYTTKGRFVVHEIERCPQAYTNGWLKKFSASFLVYCEGGQLLNYDFPVTGSVYWDIGRCPSEEDPEDLKHEVKTLQDSVQTLNGELTTLKQAASNFESLKTGLVAEAMHARQQLASVRLNLTAQNNQLQSELNETKGQFSAATRQCNLEMAAVKRRIKELNARGSSSPSDGKKPPAKKPIKKAKKPPPKKS